MKYALAGVLALPLSLFAQPNIVFVICLEPWPPPIEMKEKHPVIRSSPTRGFGSSAISLSNDVDFIRRRYNRLASIYPFFELAFALPAGIRATAIARLGLRPADAVAEIGCGTGRNLAHLVRAVGPQGRIYGVDYSDGMLDKARRLCEANRWDNVRLLRQDARQLSLPEPIHGAFFSLSYTVIPDPEVALARVWSYLETGRHVVIMDGPFFPGILGKISRPLIILLSKATVLGDPDRPAGPDLAELGGRVEKETRGFGTYYIWRATKT